MPELDNQLNRPIGLQQQRPSAPACLVLLLIVTPYAVLSFQTADHLDKDWTHLWLGGRMVVDGQALESLYDPSAQIEAYRRADPNNLPPPVWAERNDVLGCFNYPPPAALGYAALAWMPVSTAAIVNAFLNISLGLLCGYLLALALEMRHRWPLFALALLLYPAFFVNLSVGQNAMITLAVVLGAWALVEHRREWAAGMLLGLLICKPNWLLAVGWIPLVGLRWRVLLGMAGGSLGTVGFTLLVLGVQPFFDYVQVFSRVAELQQMPGYYLEVKYSASGLFHKWIGMSTLASQLAWVSSAAMIAVTAMVVRECSRGDAVSRRLAIACSLAAAMWVNPHLNYYDLMLTVPCIIAILVDRGRLDHRGRWCALLLALIAYLALPWDLSWSLNRILPVPTLINLLLWGWCIRRLVVQKWAGLSAPQSHHDEDGQQLDPQLMPQVPA